MPTTELTEPQRAARRRRAATMIRDRLAETRRAWSRPLRRPDVGLITDLAMDALGDMAAELLVDGTMMRAFTIKDGVATLEIDEATEMVKAFVAAARAVLNEYSAENYLEMEMTVAPAEERPSFSLDVQDGSTGEAYTLTVQRLHRPTPHQFRQRAETARDDALRIVAEWCVQTTNGPQDAHPHDLATDLAFRLEQAGHTLPEVVGP